MKITKLLPIIPLIASGILIGCGSGGGSASVTLGGKIIDGYISGAVVCLDLNSNNICDSGEPSTTSKSDGTYTLNYSGSVAGLQIISQIPTGAIDSDLGTINTAFTLSAPVPTDPTNYVNTHVTPLTTLVATTIQQSGGQIALSPEAAQTKIISTLGLPSTTSLTADYKASGNTSLSQIATFTAVAIAQVSNNLSNNTAVSSQLSQGQIVQAAVQQVQSTILGPALSNGSLNTAAASAVTAAISAKDTSTLTNNGGVVATAVSNAGLSSTALSTATTGGTITGSVLNIVNGTKNSSTATTVDLKSVFATNGIIAVEKDNFPTFINNSGTVSCLGSNGKSQNYSTGYGVGDNNCNNQSLQAEFIQFNTASGQNADITLDLIGNKWFNKYHSSQNLTYDGKSWVQENNGPTTAGISPTFSNNCISLPQSAGISQQFCAQQIDVSGKTISSYIPDVCSSNSSNVASNCSTATFPSGSYGYNLTLSIQSNINDVDTYNGWFQLWVDKSWTGYCTGYFTNTCQSPNSSLVDFINYSKNNNQNYNSIGNNCNTPFQISSYDPAAKTGTINFGSNSSGCSNTLFVTVESQNFVVVTKAGVDVLIYPTPSIYKANNPGNNDPFQIFAKGCVGTSTTQCGIYNGTYDPVNFSQSIPFNGDINSNTQIVSPILFDAVMAIQGQTAYPYTNPSSSGTPVSSGPYAPIAPY